MTIIALNPFLKLNRFCTKIGLESQLLINFCKTFGSHLNVPNVKWDKYHEPFKENGFVSTNYYGLCDLGASTSAIPFSLYQEVMNEITPCEIEDVDYYSRQQRNYLSNWYC